MAIKKILTHPGGAHKDDLLAVSVLIALHGVPVVRRDPTDEDLADAGVAVVDIGGFHEPALMNFDHHHFPREHPPTCALSLLLDHLGLYEDAKRFCEWLEPAEYFDARGPKRTAEWLGVPRRAIGQLNSPIDITLLRRFARCKELSPGEVLYEFMRFVGQDLLDYLKMVRERIEFVKVHSEHWSLEGGLSAIFLPRTDPPMEEPSASVSSYIRGQEITGVNAIVYPDRRGDGYGIARFEDDQRLDFCLVGDQADVRFAHKSGFMCKTTATGTERLQGLLLMAWKGGGAS